MRQRKMKQRKSKQSKSLAKILTLGIAAAMVVSSMSAPGGLLAPETVYADDNTGAAESGDQGTEPQEKPLPFDVVIVPNDSATVYVMQVTRLADTDTMSYQYSSSGGSSSGSSSGSGSSSSGSSTDSGSETAPPQEDNKDKTTTKTKTETREDGTVVTTTEIRAEDGSVQIKTEIRNEATGLNVTVNVSKNAKGKITSATAEILDRGFGNVKISGEALSEIVKAAGTKKVKTTIKMLTKNDWVIREVTVNVNTLLKRTVRPKKMKIIEIDPETGEKLVVSKMPFRVAADGSVELDHNELGHGTYELVTADEEEALTKQILRSIKATKQSASIREKQGTYFWFKKGVNWDNVDKVTFSVLNPDVARVSSNGRITGLKPGKTVVKAVVRLENGQSKVIRMTVTVNKKK